MVKYRAFSFRDTMEVEVTEKGFFGGERKYTQTTRRYATTKQLYEAIAAFATALGHRLITISGTPWSESDTTYMNGDVVVWYHE